MSNKLYDFLKDCSLVYVEAIGGFYLTVATVWGLPYGDEVLATCTAVGVLLGAFVKVKSATYNDEIIQDPMNGLEE